MRAVSLEPIDFDFNYRGLRYLADSRYLTRFTILPGVSYYNIPELKKKEKEFLQIKYGEEALSSLGLTTF